MHCLTVAPRPCLCARQALGGTGTVPGSPTARLFACQSARMVESASDLEFAIARHPPGKGPDVRGVKVLIFTVLTFSHVGGNQHHCFFRHNCHFGEYHPHLHHHDFRGSVSLKPTYAEKWESILQRFGQYHNTCFCNGHIIAGTGAVNQMYSFAHCGFLSPGDQNECSVRCLSGHAFTDGTTEAELSCHHGVWDPVEDCKPVCDPPCQNGGRCLSENQCLCGEVCALSMHTLTINNFQPLKGLPRRSMSVPSNGLQSKQTRIQRRIQLLRNWKVQFTIGITIMNHDHDHDDNLLHHQLNILVSFEMSVAGFLLVQSGANLHLQIFRWILPSISGHC